MTGTEIYKRTPAYEREARSIRLHAPQWKLLLAYDGQRSLAEVALSAEVPFADALPLTQKFLDHAWIQEEPITLDQYLKRTGARDISGLGSAVPPAVILHEPQKGAPPMPPAPPLPRTPIPATLPTVASSSASAPATAVESAPVPRTPRGPMRLNAVVDYITSLVGNIALGQLLVYRVFLRVPPELLQAEDIVSVHLLNDSSVVRGEALQRAIANAVSSVAQRPLPDGVFSPA